MVHIVEQPMAANSKAIMIDTKVNLGAYREAE
jgi:hypothetical protein